MSAWLPRTVRRSPVKAADAPTPSGVDGASTCGRRNRRADTRHHSQRLSAAPLLDHVLMETLQRRTGAARVRQVAARRTQRVPGRGRPHGRHADTNAEYFYIYAGDDPINATDSTGLAWDELCACGTDEGAPLPRAGEFAGSEGGEISYEVRTRKAPGRDFGVSRTIVERVRGRTVSVTHQVILETERGGMIVHQHTTWIGRFGGRWIAPPSWARFPRIGG